jgi:hypothetical protein
MDFSVLKINGRAFSPSKELVGEKDAKYFPIVNGYNLHGDKISLLNVISKANVKLVGFSSSQLGAHFVSSWLNPFYNTFKDNRKVLNPHSTFYILFPVCSLNIFYISLYT